METKHMFVDTDSIFFKIAYKAKSQAQLRRSYNAFCRNMELEVKNKIKSENLDAEPRLYYHDEVAWSVAEEDADRVLEILTESFAEGPKEMGVDIMAGEGTIGNNYAEVH